MSCCAGHNACYSEWSSEIHYCRGENHKYNLGRHHVARTSAAVTLVLYVFILYGIFGCGTDAYLRFSEPLYTTQDSFKSCTTFPAALHVLQILAPDLIARLHEDHQVSSGMHCPDKMFVCKPTRWSERCQIWATGTFSALSGRIAFPDKSEDPFFVSRSHCSLSRAVHAHLIICAIRCRSTPGGQAP